MKRGNSIKYLTILLALLPLALTPALLSSTEPAVARQIKQADAVAKLKAETSLGLVPSDVSFHFASLRMKEQVDWLRSTKAFAKIAELPMVREGWRELEEAWQNREEFSPFRRFLFLKENQDLLALALEMVSDEFFVTGGKNVKEFVDLLSTLYATWQFAPLAALMEMRFDEESREKAQVKALLDALSEAADEETLKVPDLVLGFRVKGKDNAKAQLTRLENLVKLAASQVPEMEGRMKRASSENGELLTFTLDGSMVPWSELPIREYEEDSGDYDDLIDYLKKMKMTISLGIKGDYVVLAIGETSKMVQDLGQGSTLAENEDVRPLLAHAQRRLTGLRYTSKDFLLLSAYNPEDYEELAEAIGEWLEELDLPEEKAEKLAKDLQRMFEDLAPFQSKPGAVVGCSFISERGQESFTYDRSTYPTADASKPLQLISHLGGNPIFAWVSRSKMSQESWANFVKWTKIGYGHFHDLAAPYMPDDVREAYTEVMRWAGPLLTKFEVTTRTKLLPALADSSGGMVIDGKLKSKQWVAEMPEADEPLPLPELAAVFGVSDANLLKQAMTEYRGILNELISEVIALAGGMVPEFSIPEPESKSISGGTVYFYPLPEELGAIGLDPQLQPSAGLSPRLATLGLSIAHHERLHRSTPLAQVEDLPFDVKRAASTFILFDFHAAQDFIRPWARYGTEQAKEEMSEEDREQMKEYLPQVYVILDSFKLLRRYASITYQDQGIFVTHSVLEVRDID